MPGCWLRKRFGYDHRYFIPACNCTATAGLKGNEHSMKLRSSQRGLPCVSDAKATCSMQWLAWRGTNIQWNSEALKERGLPCVSDAKTNTLKCTDRLGSGIRTGRKPCWDFCFSLAIFMTVTPFKTVPASQARQNADEKRRRALRGI